MRDRDTDLLVRVLSTAVVVPLVVAAVLLGGWWLFGFLMLVATLAIAEYVSLLRALSYQPWLPFSLGLGWAVLAHAILPDLGLLWPAVAVVLFASLCLHLWRDLSKTPLENWLLGLGGALYISWSVGHMLSLASLPQGELWLLAVILLTALSDTGAYFGGRAWGKHKLAIRLSPKKTWEGLASGIVLATVCGPLVTGLSGLGWWPGLALGFVVSVTAPLGDLGVSMIKRQAGVKDTGRLIPGHGGVLDRVDSQLVAAVIGYYFVLIYTVVQP